MSMSERVENSLFIAFIVALMMVAAGFHIHQDALNKQGIEIITNPLFAGEVISKKTINKRLSMHPLSEYTIYQIHIIGGYLRAPDSDKIIYFNRKLSVPKEVFDSYEVGDVISNH